MSAQQFAYGFVKAVLSGDSMVLMGGPVSPGGPPAEKVVALTGIEAPRFARSKSDKDEPFAWEAREFLRKKCIGKQVAFKTLGSSGGGREYAFVYLGQENLNESVVKNGFANVKVSPTGSRPSGDKEELLKCEEFAKQQKLGMFCGDAPENHVRNVDWAPSTASVYKSFKGKAVPAVVSQVRDGTTLRCEVQGSCKSPSKTGRDAMIINLNLAGALSPRVPLSLEYRQKVHEKALAEDPAYSGAAPEAEEAPEYAEEAIRFVEMRLLNRDVNIVILGVDMSDNLYGVIQYAKGNITQRLLETGFASFVPWSSMMTPDRETLRVAAETAKAQKLRLGATAVDEAASVQYSGKVVYVSSGDTIHVDDGSVPNADPMDSKFRVSLSSIRAPRLGRRGDKDEAGAFEAREYLRKRLIGKKVRVVVDYTRSDGSGTRSYATIIHGDTNVAVDLVAQGLATTIPHRQSEPRSLDYAKLMDAQMSARASGAGPKKAAGQIVDCTSGPRRGKENKDDSVQSAGGKARQFLPFLQRESYVNAIVEYVFSGSRLKLYVPKENCVISLALVGIRCPRPTEPFGAEAQMFIRSKCLQHQVRISVETVDKGDNFIGSVWAGPVNLGVALLELGYAQLLHRSAERSTTYMQLQTAEKQAKEAKLNIWETFVEQIVDTTEDVEESVGKGLKEIMEVQITEITDGASFYFQVPSEGNFAVVNEKMAEFNSNVPESMAETPARGATLAGLYTDGKWYRVKVDSVRGNDAEVSFIDFGNKDVLEIKNLRELPEDLAKLPALARAAVLAGLKTPAKNSEYFEAAAVTFNEVAYDQILTAKVECIGKDGKVHITLTCPNEAMSVNDLLVRDGWCRILERPEWKLKSLCASLKEHEDVAKKTRLNIWEYGDVSDDEEDDMPNRRFDGRPPARSG